MQDSIELDLGQLLLAIGENHDKKVFEWRDSFIPFLKDVVAAV